MDGATLLGVQAFWGSAAACMSLHELLWLSIAMTWPGHNLLCWRSHPNPCSCGRFLAQADATPPA